MIYMYLKKPLISLVFFCMLSIGAKSQESILSDLSYLYMEKLIATAKENYPRLKNFNHQVEAAKSRLASQKGAWLDPLSFSYNYTTDGGGVSPGETGRTLLLSGYQFGVSLSPSIFFRNSANVRSAKEEVKIAQLSKEEYDLQLEAEVKRRYLLYLQSFNVLKLRTKALLDIQATYQVLKARFEKNEVNFEDYNNSAIGLNSAQEANISAEIAVATSKALLEELLTKKLEEVK